MDKVEMKIKSDEPVGIGLSTTTVNAEINVQNLSH